MSNAEKYHFADFTRDNYRRLLCLAQKKYHFRDYIDFEPHEKFILWRHDVDFSMHAAIKLARIEAEEGVVATYFLHLHNEFYNLLESEITQIVRDILALGHHIGLHFDTHYYAIGQESFLEVWLKREARFLEEIFEYPIRVFSFHNPDSYTLSYHQSQYSGLLNTSSAYFQAHVDYCSDSNGYWRHRRLEDILIEAKDERLQVLTHPAWWQDTILSPKERILRCIDGRTEKTKRCYAAILKEFGRENIDWE